MIMREQLLRLRESEKLRKSEQHIRYLTKFDALTGLLNRHAIHLKLEQCVKPAESDHSQIVVVFIDLDHFKPINDRYGHAAGDRILKIIAKRMQHQVRSEDCVGPIGRRRIYHHPAWTQPGNERLEGRGAHSANGRRADRNRGRSSSECDSQHRTQPVSRRRQQQ